MAKASSSLGNCIDFQQTPHRIHGYTSAGTGGTEYDLENDIKL